ncbi:hypothetical protein H6P81_015262 [Aristolochia fimbriata]|uniref:Non-haem dioxygenase N-terminal domain-containing protein n=1 Tax=Aristolochia fimbriata TaxID=158543 RepID=A0AAV7E8T9_ARIFI|nr:hypothetical protein H6P81_015262 [Aristolochia fimbriata]
MVDSGITTINPRFFIHSPHKLVTGVVLRSTEQHSIHQQIPTIDLSELFDSPAARSHIVERIRDASARLGFFYILNHGVPVPVLEATISAVKASTTSRPKRIRKPPHYVRWTRNGGRHLLYEPGPFPSRGRCLARHSPRQNSPGLARLGQGSGHTPGRVNAMGRVDAEALSGLRSPGRPEEEECLEFRQILGHCYLCFPQPELTLGIGADTDPLLLTILLQSEREGLQVKIGDEYWVDVEPVRGALVVNIGDFLQKSRYTLYLMFDDDWFSICEDDIERIVQERGASGGGQFR